MTLQKQFILQEEVKLKRDFLKISKTKLKSRLIVGTGKYKSFKETAEAVKASGADMITVAVRRVNIIDKRKPMLTDYLNQKSNQGDMVGCLILQILGCIQMFLIIWSCQD